jgi:hypothetical protein
VLGNRRLGAGTPGEIAIGDPVTGSLRIEEGTHSVRAKANVDQKPLKGAIAQVKILLGKPLDDWEKAYGSLPQKNWLKDSSAHGSSLADRAI